MAIGLTGLELGHLARMLKQFGDVGSCTAPTTHSFKGLTTTWLMPEAKAVEIRLMFLLVVLEPS